MKDNSLAEFIIRTVTRGGLMVTKQEEIREGVEDILSGGGRDFHLRDVVTDIMNYLVSKGVVIKVADTTRDIAGFNHPDIVVVESLIKDG